MFSFVLCLHCSVLFTQFNQAHGLYRATVAWFSVVFIYSKTGGSEKFCQVFD